MKKFKLRYANFDRESGVSKVTIITDLGDFTGVSKMSPEEEFPSAFFGCGLAEIRAHQKYYLMKIRAQKAVVKQLKALKHNIEETRTFKPNFQYMMVVNAWNDAIIELQNYQAALRGLKEVETQRISFRDVTLEALKAKKAGKNG